jgi:hypothetical protein
MARIRQHRTRRINYHRRYSDIGSRTAIYNVNNVKIKCTGSSVIRITRILFAITTWLIDPGPLATLLRHLPKDYSITESMLKAVVLKESLKGEKISLLLAYRGKDIAIAF